MYLIWNAFIVEKFNFITITCHFSLWQYFNWIFIPTQNVISDCILSKHDHVSCFAILWKHVPPCYFLSFPRNYKKAITSTCLKFSRPYPKEGYTIMHMSYTVGLDECVVCGCDLLSCSGLGITHVMVQRIHIYQVVMMRLASCTVYPETSLI